MAIDASCKRYEICGSYAAYASAADVREAANTDPNVIVNTGKLKNSILAKPVEFAGLYQKNQYMEDTLQLVGMISTIACAEGLGLEISAEVKKVTNEGWFSAHLLNEITRMTGFREGRKELLVIKVDQTPIAIFEPNEKVLTPVGLMLVRPDSRLCNIGWVKTVYKYPNGDLALSTQYDDPQMPERLKRICNSAQKSWICFDDSVLQQVKDNPFYCDMLKAYIQVNKLDTKFGLMASVLEDIGGKLSSDTLEKNFYTQQKYEVSNEVSEYFRSYAPAINPAAICGHLGQADCDDLFSKHLLIHNENGRIDSFLGCYKIENFHGKDIMVLPPLNSNCDLLPVNNEDIKINYYLKSKDPFILQISVEWGDTTYSKCYSEWDCWQIGLPFIMEELGARLSTTEGKADYIIVDVEDQVQEKKIDDSIKFIHLCTAQPGQDKKSNTYIESKHLPMPNSQAKNELYFLPYCNNTAIRYQWAKNDTNFTWKILERDTAVRRIGIRVKDNEDEGTALIFCPRSDRRQNIDTPVNIALDAAATTMVAMFGSGEFEPREIETTGLNTLLTPITAEEEVTYRGKRVKIRKPGTSFPAAEQIFKDAFLDPSDRTSAISQLATCRSFLDEEVIKNTLTNATENIIDPFAESGMLYQPKVMLAQKIPDGRKRMQAKKGQALLIAEALISFQRALAKEGYQDISYFISYPESYAGIGEDSKTYIVQAIQIVNEHLTGDTALEEWRNVFPVSEAVSAASYYKTVQLPNGNSVGDHYVTVDIGASTMDIGIVLKNEFRNLSIPYAGNRITVQSMIAAFLKKQGEDDELWRESFRKIFDSNKMTNEDSKTLEKIEERFSACKKDPNAYRKLVNNTSVQGLCDLMLPKLEARRLREPDTKLLYLLSRYKLCILFKLISDVVGKAAKQAKIAPNGDIPLPIILLGKGALAIENAGSDELRKNLGIRVSQDTGFRASLQFKKDSKKEELVRGMLALEMDEHGVPKIPNLTTVDFDLAKHHAGLLKDDSRYQKIKEVESSPFGQNEEKAMRDALRHDAFNVVHENFSFERYKDMAEKSFLPEILPPEQDGMKDAYLSNNNEKQFYELLLIDDAEGFKDAKQYMTGCEDFVMSVPGEEEWTYFLCISDYIITNELAKIAAGVKGGV